MYQVKAGNIKENAQQMAAIVKLERVALILLVLHLPHANMHHFSASMSTWCRCHQSCALDFMRTPYQDKTATCISAHSLKVGNAPKTHQSNDGIRSTMAQVWHDLVKAEKDGKSGGGGGGGGGLFGSFFGGGGSSRASDIK